MAQFDEIFNLILQVSALIGMVPNVVVETTEFCGVSLGPILSQRLWPAIVDLLFGGNKDVLPSVHNLRVLGVLGDISFFLGPPPPCGRG